MDVRVGNRTVHILVPAKCGNVAVKNRTRSPLPKPKIKKPKKTKTGKIVCGPNFKLVGGNCVQQAANAEQNCKAVGGSYNNQNGLCTIVQVVGNCSNIVVVNGSGNVVSANQGGNCNNNPPSAPPSPPSPPSPPPPPPPVTPPPPTDVCPNLPGIQTSVPAGYVKDSNGNCIIPPPPTCPPGQTGTPPDCKVPPPPAQPPALSNLTQPQEVFSDGETYPNINVTASAMNGHSITVSCGAQYGSMTGSQTITSGGVDTLSFTYTAPNTPDAAGRTENISCTVHDNTTGLNGNTVSVSFPIMKPPANP
jgi:hypothetical protein